MSARIYTHIILYAALAFFSVLMLQITFEYIPIRFDVSFLQTKVEEVQWPYYRVAFYVHVYTSMFALIAGFTQFSRRIRIKYTAIHRAIGKTYFYVVVFLSGPSGFIMAYHANGGWTSQLAFLLLAALWIISTIMAVTTIQKGNVIDHRKWMMRSYALTLSAITLRLWKWGIVKVFEPRPMDVYRVVAWMGWVLNALVAEYLIRRKS
ncbi:MAG: DUF2306 domain-containing protein [Flavobacteriales bacterium]